MNPFVFQELTNQREQQELHDLMRRINGVVRRVMFDLGINFWPGKNDERLEFLIWLQWSRRYRVPLGKLARIIILELRRKFKRSGDNLGISMQHLTSPSVEEWLPLRLRTLGISDPDLVKSPSESEDITIPTRYNSVEAYSRRMIMLRKRSRSRRDLGKAYRNSKYWSRPIPDIVRSSLQ